VDLAHLEQLIAPKLARLDGEMRRILGTDHPFLEKLNEHVMAVPGKRLRPKLLLLCAELLDHPAEKALTYGAVFELIHTATLIHDDIIDEAGTRRGRKTLNARIGNVLTVLYGDLLYTKAHRAACEAGDVAVVATIDAVSEKMIEGELLQNKVTFDLGIDRATYFDILARKTAHLFAGTTRVAGLIAGAEARIVDALDTYGYEIGTSFQLIDDYLDYTSTAEAMGKPVLSDLRGGKVTLPVITALALDQGRLRKAIEAWWADEEAAVPAELEAAIHEAGGLAETHRLAKEAAERAIAATRDLPANRYREILAALPTFLLGRIT